VVREEVQPVVPMSTPRPIQEIADSMFGEKEFLPISKFQRKMGMDRKTVLKLTAEGLLGVHEYHTGVYRKLIIPKAGFIRFLKATSLEKQ